MLKQINKKINLMFNNKQFNSRCLIFIFATPFAIAILMQAHFSLHWGHDSWHMTEWLINYTGGFVRRGLMGELIYLFSSYTSIKANYIVITLSFASFIILLRFLITYTSGLFPSPLILSPVILGINVYSEDIVRKDNFELLLLILCLSIYRKNYHAALKIVLINFIAIIAILSHESFIFFALPALLIMQLKPSLNSWTAELNNLLIVIFKLCPTVIASVLVLLYHGNPAIANSINSSWHDLWVYVEPGKCCFNKPFGAIQFLGYNTIQGLQFTINSQVATNIYNPIAWCITIAACFVYLVGFLGYNISNNIEKYKHEVIAQKYSLATVLIFQLIVISPLFILSADYGRWIFFWTTSSIIIYIYKFNYECHLIQYIYKKSQQHIPLQLITWKPKLRYLSVFLIFGIPEFTWTIHSCFFSSPIGSFYSYCNVHHIVKTIYSNFLEII